MKQSLLIIATFLLISCSKPIKEERLNPQNAWSNGVIYEIFVQSFADSNGDGIGDISGMTSKLDYLQDLGIKGIWLMPMSPSPSYHKYDVTDYYGIHPDYGTMDDFKHFVKEAHKRDIKIVIDFVVNHTSEEHPWFKEAIKSKESKFRDYYVWANIDSIKDQLAKKVVTLDSDNITQWHQNARLPDGQEEGYAIPADKQEYYYGFFWKGMPDLNYDNPSVRAEMIKAGQFWLEKINVDGLRLDAAKHVFADDEAEKSYQWWIEFGDAMRSVKPDVYLVGEVWGNNSDLAPYVKGLHSMFNFPLYFAINNLIKNEQNNGLLDTLINARKAYANVSPDFTDATLVNNHDRNRLISVMDGSIEKHKQAFAILLTLPGTPYVYYGDEIGMLGQKPDEMIREPFLWDAESTDLMRTKWIIPTNSTDSTVVPLAKQMRNPNSTYQFFKAWIGNRNSTQVLQEGDLQSITLNSELLGYSRTLGEERLVIIHNLTGLEVEVSLLEVNCSKVQFYFGSEPNIVNNHLFLSPHQSIVLK